MLRKLGFRGERYCASDALRHIAGLGEASVTQDQHDPAINVLYTEVERDGDAKFFGNRPPVTRTGIFDANRFADSLAALCRQMDGVFTKVESASGQFELDSFDVTVEFTAGGEIRLVGSVSVEVKGGATLTFRRKSADAGAS